MRALLLLLRAAGQFENPLKMVAHGQFLERPALIDAGGIWLEGLYHRGDRRPAVLICPPLSSGLAMDAPPVAELAFAAARRDLPSLRFQHRGVGASTGQRDPDRFLEDALAALQHLTECDGPAIAIASYLDGARAALLLAAQNPRIRSLALIGPPAASELPPLGDRRLIVVLPDEATEERRLAWSTALADRDDSRLELHGGPDDSFLRGLVQVAAAALAFIAE